jgi:sphingomyelin phosphodiesterase 2
MLIASMTNALPLQVLTLNVWGIPYSKHRRKRIPALAAVFAEQHYDIICLQEVWTPADLQLLARGAQAGGINYHHYFPSGAVGSGMAIFSRYPIIDADFYRYRLGGTAETIWHGDYLAGKGVGLVRIETPAGVVDVYNTHAIAQYHPDEVDAYRAHRAAQLYEATRYINAETTRNPIIFCGDFNVRSTHLGYEVIKTLLGVTDTYAALHPEENGITLSTDNPYKQEEVDQRIDYIFARDGYDIKLTPTFSEVTLKQIPETEMAYSDHYGVITSLQIEPASDTDPEPSTEDVRKLLETLQYTLDDGLTLMLGRKRRNSTRFRGNLLAILPVYWNSRYRPSSFNAPLLILIMISAFMRGVLAYFFDPDELHALQAIKSEVRTRLDNLE